jgi:hypothetical protein
MANPNKLKQEEFVYNPDYITTKDELGNVYFKDVTFNVTVKPSEKFIKTCIAGYMYNDRIVRPNAQNYLAPNKSIMMQIIKAQVEKGGRDAIENIDRYWSDKILDFRDDINNIPTIEQMYDYISARYFNIFM